MLSILKFFISLEYEKDDRGLCDIEEELVKIYSAFYPKITDYKDLVIKEWQKKKANGIKEHYYDEDIKVFSDEQGNDYFFINQKDIAPVNKKTYLIFILVNSEDLMNVFEIIIKDIKKKLRNKNIKSKVIYDKGIFLMPCSVEKIDVIDSKNHIKVEIVDRRIPDLRSVIKYGIYILIGILLYIFIPKNTNNAGIVGSIIASFVFVILTDFIMVLLSKKEFIINNFSNFYLPIYTVDEDLNFVGNEERNSLTTPEV